MLQCSFLFIIQEIIIFMTSCKLVIGIYKGLYLACIMQTYGCPLLYGAFLATWIKHCMVSDGQSIDLTMHGIRII